MKDAIGDETPPASRGSRARWQVLIVDDEMDLRESFRDLLKGEGYEVIEAADGRAALDILRASRHPMVVLLDLMMPGMRGDSVIETLIKERRLPGKHAIILITASPSTVPHTIHPVLARLQIPVRRKDITPDEILDLLDQASAQITRQQEQPW